MPHSPLGFPLFQMSPLVRNGCLLSAAGSLPQESPAALVRSWYQQEPQESSMRARPGPKTDARFLSAPHHDCWLSIWACMGARQEILWWGFQVSVNNTPSFPRSCAPAEKQTREADRGIGRSASSLTRRRSPEAASRLPDDCASSLGVPSPLCFSVQLPRVKLGSPHQKGYPELLPLVGCG